MSFFSILPFLIISLSPFDARLLDLSRKIQVHFSNRFQKQRFSFLSFRDLQFSKKMLWIIIHPLFLKHFFRISFIACSLPLSSIRQSFPFMFRNCCKHTFQFISSCHSKMLDNFFPPISLKKWTEGRSNLQKREIWRKGEWNIKQKGEGREKLVTPKVTWFLMSLNFCLLSHHFPSRDEMISKRETREMERERGNGYQTWDNCHTQVIHDSIS